MGDDAIVGLTTIVVLGVGAQWIGRRVGFPSLLLLLPAGMIAGDGLGLVDPEALFGETLFPLVTLLVSLLLFQSAQQLRLADLPREARGPVLRLNTVGALITFIGATTAVQMLFDAPLGISALIGAIVIVSGPTVVGPLLEVIRPRATTRSILAWEGTVLDPIGATVGVVVLNIVIATNRGEIHALAQLFSRLGLGVAVGLVAAGLLVLVMSKFLVTDNMEAAVAVLFAVAAFGIAETLLSEAGLFATVTLGVVAANQRLVPTARIAGFGETLEVLIIGILFILLGALVDVDALEARFWTIVVLVAVLVVVVRPIGALASLLGSKVPWRDRGMIAWMDPRGIVAAATAAQFSGTLEQSGIDASLVSPVVFGVILGTGIVYGLTARPVARLLQVARAAPTGVAFVGDAPWVFDLAARLRDAGAPVVVITARVQGAVADANGVPELPLLESEQELEAAIIDAGIEKAVIATRPNPVVTMMTADLVELLGRRHVLRVPTDLDAAARRLAHPLHQAPQAFDDGVTLDAIAERVGRGAQVIELPEGSVLPDDALPIATVRPNGTVDLRPGLRRQTTVGRRFALVG
ncbi:MAG: cation:proton antiporter [Acidimicrobiales bacterium]|nr:cation:proton antiporter [Acidimicrobiales bacterium]